MPLPSELLFGLIDATSNAGVGPPGKSGSQSELYSCAEASSQYSLDSRRSSQ
jgi:hypothetical protein